MTEEERGERRATSDNVTIFNSVALLYGSSAIGEVLIIS